MDGLAAHVDGTEWCPDRAYLTYLGCGRFCVTRFFHTTLDCYKPTYHIAVTAVEETRGAAGTGKLRMVKRASRR